jgi:diguanylate cyclase (GGDEF)-like protein/PAS domain S-box-containing protein
VTSEVKEPRIRSFLRSLPGRMIVSIFVLTLILGTILVSSILFLSTRAQKEFFVQNIQEETHALADMVGRNPDYTAIKNIFANATKSHSVVYVELDGSKAGNGGSLKMAKNSHLMFLQDTEFGGHDDNVYYLSEPVRDGNGNSIGVLKIGYDELRLTNQARHMIHRSLVFSLVYMWALLLIAASLAVRLTGPIKLLQKACREIASGQIDKELNVESNISEISDLGSDLEHMRQELVARNKRIAASEARYVAILDNAAEGIFTFDKQGVIHSFNRSAEQLFGYGADEVVGKDITLLIPPPDAFDRRNGYVEHFMRTEINRLIGHEGEVLGYHKDGASFHMALKISVVMLEDKEMFTALAADISERKALMEHLRSMAEHDGLTGLYNRSHFQDELERLVDLTKRTKQPSALLYIDLDHFKYVNDTLGHGAGDRLLIEISTILVKRARKSDLISRLGGDEFTVLLCNTQADQVHNTAESFRRALADYPFKQGVEQVDIGCSIGVAMITEETQSAGEVLSRADIACHLAKRGGRNRVHIFNPTDEADVTAMSVDMGWSRRIKEAIETGRFALACQPIVATHNGEIESFEVLIRMLDEQNGLIMPGAFLPSAERFGLAVDVDKWVIVNAIETLAEQRRHSPGMRYSLNLSGQTLTDPSVCDLIHETLRRSDLDPAALTFEVTETAAIADMSLAETFLSRLRQIGCRTALDDFGSGMSSFAYLRDLPVDYVKIDGRFVKNMATNPVDQAMVKAMNEIAHALGKQTIAEFVEDAVTMKLLQAYGIDYVQGYYLGRPNVVMPCEAISDHAGVRSLCLVSSAN